MHVGTSLKRGWGNWFLIVGTQWSNLVLLRTLHEFASVPVKHKLHNLLYLELVLNTDQMVVKPILIIAKSSGAFRIHPICVNVSSQKPTHSRQNNDIGLGQIKMPLVICCGPAGTLILFRQCG